MNDEPITWGIVLRVYWLIAWRTIAMYVVAYAPFILWLMATGRIDDRSYFYLRYAMVFPLLFGAAFIAVRMALRKRYRGFRIQITRDPVS